VIGAFIVALALAAPMQSAERVAEITVHGNTLTPDADVIGLSGVSVGMDVTDRTIEDATARLRATKKFEKVEVLKRYASISDLSQVMIVIVVDEGPVKIVPTKNGTPAHVEKGGGTHVMFLPILDYEDGYGVTYGVRFALPNALGPGTRVSFPATWGGDRRAAVEVEKNLRASAWQPLSRLQAGGAVSSRTNPYFDEDDNRRAVWVRGERSVARWLRGGVTAGWDHVSFLGGVDQFARVGADVIVDTRLEPMLPRNAIYGRAAWDRLSFDVTGVAHRTELDGRGYIGLVGQSVLVLRATRQDSDRPLPSYLKPMLGGMDSLRGFKRGTAIGDTVVTSSAELRVPLSSPLSVAKLGITGFVDAGTAYPKGEKLSDQDFAHGVGGGVWLSVAVVQLNFTIAHGVGHSTRVHFGTSVTF
jgi:hypothetical protein